MVVNHQTRDVASDAAMYLTRTTPDNDWVFFYDIAVLLLGLVVAFVVVWSALSAYFANRKALRVLAESFGAVPPAKPGAPSTCRQCGAPLPSVEGALVVRCVYCSAENVLGVDPRSAASRQRQERSDLQAAVQGRRRARLRLLLTVPICAFLGVVAVREAVLLWWVPTLASDTYCLWSHCGNIHNNDSVRRTLSLTNGKESTRGTILPHSTVGWYCSGECVIHAGGASVQASDQRAQSSVVIAHGNCEPLRESRAEGGGGGRARLAADEPYCPSARVTRFFRSCSSTGLVK